MGIPEMFDDDLWQLHISLYRELLAIERDIECLALPRCVVKTLEIKAYEYRARIDVIESEIRRRGDEPRYG